MNFTSLNYFLVTSRELNITRAAEKLFISQQALSEHIQKLESELNVRLFDRSRSLTLTYAGRQLAQYASKILSLENQLRQTAWDISRDIRGELRIGLSHTCSRALLPNILPEFKATHPMVDIRLTEGNSGVLETALERGDLDLIIGFSPFNLESIETVRLVEERLFLVVPKVLLTRYFGACRPAIVSECQRKLDISLFRPLPFIMLEEGNRTRSIADRYMVSEGFRPNIVLETDNIETAFALAEKGMGLTVYPEIFYLCLHAAEASASPVELFAMDDGTGGCLQIGWMPDRYQPHAAKDFTELCVRILGDLAESPQNYSI